MYLIDITEIPLEIWLNKEDSHKLSDVLDNNIYLIKYKNNFDINNGYKINGDEEILQIQCINDYDVANNDIILIEIIKPTPKNMKCEHFVASINHE